MQNDSLRALALTNTSYAAIVAGQVSSDSATPFGLTGVDLETQAHATLAYHRQPVRDICTHTLEPARMASASLDRTLQLATWHEPRGSIQT